MTNSQSNLTLSTPMVTAGSSPTPTLVVVFESSTTTIPQTSTDPVGSPGSTILSATMETKHWTAARSIGNEKFTEGTNSTGVSPVAHRVSKLYVVPWLILAIAILAILIAAVTLIFKFSKQMRLVRKNSRQNKPLGSQSERSVATELPALESQSVRGLSGIGSESADWRYHVDVIAGVNARSMFDASGRLDRDGDQHIAGFKSND
jgi:hypothetical protein